MISNDRSAKRTITAINSETNDDIKNILPIYSDDTIDDIKHKLAHEMGCSSEEIYLFAKHSEFINIENDFKTLNISGEQRRSGISQITTNQMRTYILNRPLPNSKPRTDTLDTLANNNQSIDQPEPEP